MAKSADAFRTISEVADWLGSPAHVLRFWESKFSQIKPVKRAGGRRYYRPADMALLGGIKKLLHDDGMTIKGVQKVLREQGVKYVSGLSQPLDEASAQALNDAAADGGTEAGLMIDAVAAPPPDEPKVVPFQRAAEPAPAPEPEPEPAPQATSEPAPAPAAKSAPQPESEPESAPQPSPEPAAAVPGTPAADTTVFEDFATTTAPEPEPEAEPAPEPIAESKPESAPAPEAQPEPQPEPDSPAEATTEAEPDPQPESTPDPTEPAGEPRPNIPAFLHRSAAAKPTSEPEPDTPAPAPKSTSTPEPEPDPEPAILRPAKVDVPPDPIDADITATPGPLSRIAARKGRPLPAATRPQAAALRDQLAALRERRRPQAKDHD